MQKNYANAAPKRTSFLDLAQKLGQSVERLKAGEPVETVVRIHSVDEFKDIFAGNVTADQRDSFSKDMEIRHGESLQSSDPMARLYHHVLGNAPLSLEDSNTASMMFPLDVTVFSVADMPVTTNITYGPSASPVVLNVGTLTFNGGSITTQNTVLTLNADTVAFGTTPGTLPYHIGITGVNGAVGTAGSVGTAPNPAQAASGSNASARSPGVCTGVGNGGNGSAGATGHTGGNGLPGQNGLANQPATISIGSFSTTLPGKLVLYGVSGAGGAGGAGGTGGAGQQGGNGGNGCDSGCEGTDGGNAGNGGPGGMGGNGSNGGNGVNGFSTTVTVPAGAISNVLTSTAIAPVGQGGAAGSGGSGGGAGSKGSGGKGSSDGSAGTQGNPGGIGTVGTAGTQQGSAGQFYISAS
jgi:hypothetical protein